jgi:hypothetical protein
MARRVRFQIWYSPRFRVVVGLLLLSFLLYLNDVSDSVLSKIVPWFYSSPQSYIINGIVVVLMIMDISRGGLTWLLFVVALFVFSALTWFFFVGLPAIVAFAHWTASAAEKVGLSVPYVGVIVIASALLAYAAFYLRRVNRMAYGHIEVLFGIASILYSASQSKDLTHLGVPFFAGMYIVVRGLTNIEDSLAQAERPLNVAGYFRSLWWDFLLAALFVEQTMADLDPVPPQKIDDGRVQ